MATITSAPVGWKQTNHPLPRNVDNVVLAGAAKTITVPAGHSWVEISVSDLCWVCTSGVAAIVPVGDSDGAGGRPAAGDGSFPIVPGYWPPFSVKGLLAFSMIGTATVGLSWLRDQSDL